MPRALRGRGRCAAEHVTKVVKNLPHLLRVVRLLVHVVSAWDVHAEFAIEVKYEF